MQTLVQTSSPCTVEARDSKIASAIWFKTDAVSRDFCANLTEIQLHASSHDQGWVDERGRGNWTWFELVILPNSNTDQPRVKNGKSLVLKSHENVEADSTTRSHDGAIATRSNLLDDLEVCHDESGPEHHI